MGFFSKILDKLGFDAAAAKLEEKQRGTTASAPSAATAGAPASATAAPAGTAPGSATVASANTGAAAPATASTQPAQSAPQVDVTALLEQKAAANPQKLNWRTSIVDLLKLLDLDSSLQARKELATELGCPPNLMADSAQMNMWLHKAVMQKLAANGGKVPAELLA